jgi:hypothetical protein
MVGLLTLIAVFVVARGVAATALRRVGAGLAQLHPSVRPDPPAGMVSALGAALALATLILTAVVLAPGPNGVRQPVLTSAIGGTLLRGSDGQSPDHRADILNPSSSIAGSATPRCSRRNSSTALPPADPPVAPED